MERLTNLLAILQKRDPKTPGLAERIERVKRDIANFQNPISPIPVPADKPKKKKTKVVEVEDDE